MPVTDVGMHLFQGKVPDLTSPETWMKPLFWNWAINQWGLTDTLRKWSSAKVPGKAKIVAHLVARSGMTPHLLKNIRNFSYPGLAATTLGYVAEESRPNILQGKFNPEKADQVFPALIEGYEKKWMGKDESPYMDYSDAMLKMKDPDDLKATYVRNQTRENQNQGGKVEYDNSLPDIFEEDK